MAERGKKIICWDLDDTVGDFRGMRAINPENSQPIFLRYGITDLLNDFSEESGYRHYITSGASVGYITEALRRTHLDSNFSEIYDNDTVNQTPHGKHYRPVARYYTDEQKRAHMVVVGDGMWDKPVDIGGLVFIELGGPEKEVDALVVREILTTILENGDGNFKEGYERLYEKAQPIDSPIFPTQERRRMNIGNDIEFIMEYRRAEEVRKSELQRVPVICRIRSASHKKPFVPFF